MTDGSWEGLDDDSQDVADYLGTPTPTGPLVAPMTLSASPQISPVPGASPPSRQAPGAPRGPQVVPAATKGLGSFSPSAVCELKSLARLAYLFYDNVAAGETQKAISTLGVFRFLWNDSLATIQGGFTNPLRPVPDVSWSADMQIAVGLSLIGALGESNTRVRSVLANQPGNMAALATWFPSFQNALGPEDASIRNYANSAIPTSQPYATAIAAVVRDDLGACLAPAATATTPPPTPPVTPFVLTPAGGASTPVTIAPFRPNSSSSSGPGAGAVVGGGAGTVITIGLLGLVAYGAYLVFKEGDKPKQLAGHDPNAMLAKAKKAAAADAPKMKCLPTADARTKVSMDELAGRKGELLAAKLAEMPPSEAGPIEDAYFAELDRIRPGAPRCV